MPSRSPKSGVTPAMRQYLDAKQQHPDAVLFFRMGDFYEMFYEDALTAARALELTLTSRSKDGSGAAIPMCGVPHHAADRYVARLVKKGFRVAICEQVEDPKQAKSVLRREVVRVVSPGTLIDDGHLDAREPAFLMAFAPGAPSAAEGHPDTRRAMRPRAYGLAMLDFSTGEFQVAEYAGDAGRQAVIDEIAVFRPRELVVSSDLDRATELSGFGDLPVTGGEPWTFDPARARGTLCDQLGVRTLEGVGLEHRLAATAAAGALIQYLRDTQKRDLTHVREIRFRETSQCLVVDSTTFRHLEILDANDGSRDGSLLGTIDHTVTAMGSRRLRAWLVRPLVARERIQDRLDAVEEFAFQTVVRGKLREALKSVGDVERLVARVVLGTAGPQDLVALRHSAEALPRLRTTLSEMHAPLVTSLLAELDDLTDVRGDIESTLVDEAPALARDGGCIRTGADVELDELRDVSHGGRRQIADMEAAERARTGIASLKIRFNRVFGYYIEVSRANLHAVPSDYHRKQTIAGGERFITPTLKEYEERVVGADDQILERELALFEALRQRVAAESARIQDTARALAGLDVLAGLADTATALDYTKPQLHDGDELSATDVRHPVVERHCAESFVPNDVRLDGESQQVVILTGPNMGGKSTFLRQTALLSVLAQAGSFVPARQAKLPIVDRIFARVGASDNIARGQSTFMVEMQETAHILHTATSKSLVLLDEIGRGTATFDGLSIAWAVAEHLATHEVHRPRTLFATHYHELTDLAEARPNVVNYHVVAREYKGDVVFLRKVVPGRSDRSYGIQVARLAGLPPSVVRRARAILDDLEQDDLSRGGRPALSASAEPQSQLGLFQNNGSDDRLTRRLREVDVERLTPMDALTLLADLKSELADE